MTFNKLALHPALLSAISTLGYDEPTSIQTEAIPPILKGRDLIGMAKTGSGKTASFAFPILSKLVASAPAQKSRAPKILILVPTRELAVQVGDVFISIAQKLPRTIKVLSIHGGVSINPQMKAIYGAEILIATPGRMLDLQRSNAVDLSQVGILVLDEADKILNLGFQKEIQSILKLLPTRRQNLLFSATLTKDLESLNNILLNDPMVVDIKVETEEEPLINLSGYFVSDAKKGPLLRHIIREQNLDKVLVFTSSGTKADKVANKLFKNGINALAIHGKKSQSARTEALKQFKTGALQVLVATDLISRGIDIKELPYVINYELPRSPKDFVHRVGRTGRAKSKGEAISFVTREETRHFKVILKKMKRYMNMIDSEEMQF